MEQVALEQRFVSQESTHIERFLPTRLSRDPWVELDGMPGGLSAEQTTFQIPLSDNLELQHAEDCW